MRAKDPVGTQVPAALTAAVGACTVVAALVRLASLRALPIFGDEAINLRLAELLRQDPLRQLWISLHEAQAPLHVWLLALVLPASIDPVYAGRLLSVAAGTLTVPAAAWLAWWTTKTSANGEHPRRTAAWVAALATAGLTALCPFFVFAQRIARVDSLFVLETIVVAGLSVELASRAASAEPRGGLTVCLGALLGVTMLTRQAVSYPLWLLAPAALVLAGASRRPPGALRRLASSLLLAAVVGGALWLPMLLAPGGPDLMTRIFHAADYRPAMNLAERSQVMRVNFGLALEAFWTYLTPPILMLAGVGTLKLVLSGGSRLLGFLLAWEGLLLAPAVCFAPSYFPRYALPAAIPWLIAASCGIEWFRELIERRVAALIPRLALAVVLVTVVMGPSVRDLWRGERDWRAWRLLPVDRDQFVSGSPAGDATQQAVDWLRKAARQVPIAVLTPEISGNPTDTVWLLLGRDPRIQLGFGIEALRRPLLTPLEADGLRSLPGDARDPFRTPSRLARGKTVFAVLPDPLLTRSGWVHAAAFLSGLNPGLTEEARFANPGTNGRVEASVVVLRVANP